MMNPKDMPSPASSPLGLIAEDAIRIWQRGQWRGGSTTFQQFCVATYGRHAAVEMRRRVVARFYAEGVPNEEISKRVGVGISAVQADILALGLSNSKQPQSHRQRETNRNHAARMREAMRNAPPGATNIPMLSRTTRVIQILGELAELDPKTAASQMPAVRCREYSGAWELSGWLMEFIEACEARRVAETPTLGHLRSEKGRGRER